MVSKQEKDYDFFPLTVDFMEKMYSVGRIPGGYLKRRRSLLTKGTLTARMIDRPIRPGFPDGYKNEVHVVATTFVCDGENPPDTICVAGASAALLVGGAPFDGPAAAFASVASRRGDGRARLRRQPHLRRAGEERSRVDHRPAPPITSPWSRRGA